MPSTLKKYVLTTVQIVLVVGGGGWRLSEVLLTRVNGTADHAG